MLHELPAVLGHSIVGSKNRLRRGSAETHQNLRADRSELSLKPRPACLGFGCTRLLVDTPLPALFELKVFDGVGDVDRRSIDPGFLQRAVEQAAGRPDERTTLAIFLVTRLFAYKDDSGQRRT